MSGAPVRLALFAALLLAVFGGAALLGGAVDPEGSEAAGEQVEAGHGVDAGHGGEEHGAEAAALPGLAVAQAGLRLALDRTSVTRTGRTRLTFRIEDDHGDAVTDFEIEHAKRLHLIVVRRDLTRFQHLHPTMAPDGTWSTDVTLSAGGTYRVFADVTRDGEQQTLGADLHVPGRFTPSPLPAAGDTVTDPRGLTVRRRVEADGTVAFDVLRDGAVINDELEPYLDAKGHLVTLRTGDLAYLHTHPDGDRLAFEVERPGAGTYRSWVQFQLDGQVHTAAFTEEDAR